MDEKHSRGPARILGLTGPIGCGKTTVGDILLDLGAVERIDADRVVHSLMRPGTEVTAAVRERFGPGVIAPNGSVDRAALGRVVFSDTEALRRLESVVHPAVRIEIRKHLEDLYATGGVVVLDAVKLLQSDLLPLVDAVWVVTCDRQVELQRLTAIREMSQEDAAGRIAAQPEFEHEKVTQVIENSGTLDDLRAQVQSAWADFTNRAPHALDG